MTRGIVCFPGCQAYFRPYMFTLPFYLARNNGIVFAEGAQQWNSALGILFQHCATGNKWRLRRRFLSSCVRYNSRLHSHLSSSRSMIHIRTGVRLHPLLLSVIRDRFEWSWRIPKCTTSRFRAINDSLPPVFSSLYKYLYLYIYLYTRIKVYIKFIPLVFLSYFEH